MSSDSGAAGEPLAKASFPALSPQAHSWRVVLDTALDAVVVMNREGRIVDWNENATKIFGWTPADALGRSMADTIIPPQYREAHQRGLSRFLQTGKATVLGQRIEITGLRKSGEDFPIELSITQLDEEDGSVFVGFLRDISERKRAERLTAQHALKMETLYRAVSFASETSSFEDALHVFLDSVQKLTGWPLGHVYLPSAAEPVRLLPSPIWCSKYPEKFLELSAITAESTFAPGEGLPGKVWETGEAVWIADVDTDRQFARARRPGGVGIKSAFGFPIKVGARPIAIIEFFSEIEAQPEPDLLLTLQAIAEQVGRVFERQHAERELRAHSRTLEIEVAERTKAQEHQKFLLAEISHRVKNILAVITGIASQTARNSPSVAEFSESFVARLQSLSQAHSLLTADNWKVTQLRRLLETILSPYTSEGSSQFELDGPSLELKPKAALAVGMILHELVTNAAKYGALSVPEGKLLVRWSVDDAPRPSIHMQWQEAGVGRVEQPNKAGFGTTMIDASVRHDLGGQVKVTYGSEGMQYDFQIPLNRNSGAK